MLNGASSLEKLKETYETMSIYKTVIVTKTESEAADIFNGLEEDGHTCVRILKEDVDDDLGHGTHLSTALSTFVDGYARVFIITYHAFQLMSRLNRLTDTAPDVWDRFGQHDLLVFSKQIEPEQRMKVISKLPTSRSSEYFILQ